MADHFLDKRQDEIPTSLATDRRRGPDRRRLKTDSFSWREEIKTVPGLGPRMDNNAQRIPSAWPAESCCSMRGATAWATSSKPAYRRAAPASFIGAATVTTSLAFSPRDDESAGLAAIPESRAD